MATHDVDVVVIGVLAASGWPPLLSEFERSWSLAGWATRQEAALLRAASDRKAWAGRRDCLGITDENKTNFRSVRHSRYIHRMLA